MKKIQIVAMQLIELESILDDSDSLLRKLENEESIESESEEEDSEYELFELSEEEDSEY